MNIEIHNNITKKYPNCKFYVMSNPDIDTAHPYILRIEEEKQGINIKLTKPQTDILLSKKKLPKTDENHHLTCQYSLSPSSYSHYVGKASMMPTNACVWIIKDNSLIGHVAHDGDICSYEDVNYIWTDKYWQWIPLGKVVSEQI